MRRAFFIANLTNPSQGARLLAYAFEGLVKLARIFNALLLVL